MKKQINPALGIGIVIVVVIVAGVLFFRGSGQHVDTTASMTPELRDKLRAAYGGGRPGAAATTPPTHDRR